MTQSLTVPIYVTFSTALAALIITGIHVIWQSYVKCENRHCGLTSVVLATGTVVGGSGNRLVLVGLISARDQMELWPFCSVKLSLPGPKVSGSEKNVRGTPERN